MKILKKIPKISELSIPAALLLSALIIALSIFITAWVFSGNTRQKLPVSNVDTTRKINTSNILTPEQIRQRQEAQRQQQIQREASETENVTETENTTESSTETE